MGIRWWGLFLGGACLAVSCSVARPARADPAPESYAVTVDGGSVEVCIGPPDYILCPSPLLRQDPDGAVVSVSGTVSNGNLGPCYIDECVPPGTYRYGCETPIGCSSRYWESATVTESLDGGCARSTGDSPPTPVSGPPPWPADAQYGSCPQVGGCSAAGSVFEFIGGPVFLLSLALLWRRRRNARLA